MKQRRKMRRWARRAKKQGLTFWGYWIRQLAMTRAPLLALLISAGVACAQTPIIRDYHTTPAVIETSVGPFICGHYAQRPAAGQVQVWCRLNSVTVMNAVFTVGSIGVACSAVAPPANLVFVLIPGTSPMIGYQLGAQALTTSLPFVLSTVTSTPGNLALAGTF
jgi:hypothetical protein